MKYLANCILFVETIRKALKNQSFQWKLQKASENTQKKNVLVVLDMEPPCQDPLNIGIFCIFEGFG